MTLLTSEPEPDLAVVRGSVRDFVTHHPRAEDVAIVIEVGETSIDVDRDIKIPMYGNAEIPQYWLVDLTENRVSVFRDLRNGRYSVEESVSLGEQLTLSLDESLVAKLSVEDFLLPPLPR
jgi:Uma2 family endonuclease